MNQLSRVELTDFQSLQKTEVEFAPGLTAIIGPSNTGKSALVRAIKALVYNAPAPGLVREGASKFIAKATFSDGAAVELTKGKSVSEFVVTHPDGRADKYAKTGVKAPEEVTALWALPDFTITSQHDAPFLLDEPASAVAKRLGELTNAAMLMEAVREANQRRTAALSDEKARTREADEARSELQQHAGLTARTNAVTAARRALEDAEAAQLRADALTGLLDEYQAAAEHLAWALEDLGSTPDVAEAVSRAEGLSKKATALAVLIQRHTLGEENLTAATQAATAETLARSQAEQEIHNQMSEAGYCPLCRQGVV